MLIPLFLASSLGLALARGGRLTNLASLSLRSPLLLFVPLVLQLVAFSPVGDMSVWDSPLAQFLYLASMTCAVLALALNRHIPGVPLIALGLACNFLVISLNHGFMPTSLAARQVAGLHDLAGRSMNVVPLTDTTVLPWLADILPLPAWVPFANVFSVGDILILIGGVIFTQKSVLMAKR